MTVPRSCVARVRRATCWNRRGVGAAVLACALVLAAALTSCGDESGGRPASLEEYASWCAESSLLAVAGPQNRQGRTTPTADLEETAATLQALVANYESIGPPAEIAVLHDQTLESLRAAAATADEIPSVADVSSAEEYEELRTLRSGLERALWDVAGDMEDPANRLALSPAVRESLTAGGCLPLLQPTDVRYAPAGSAIVVSWQSVPGADSYTVYHDDLAGWSCGADSDGDALYCDELAAEVIITRFVHTRAAAGDTSYWVSACNRWHCTTIDGENPAEPIAEPQPAAASVDLEPPQATTTSTVTDISRADFEAAGPEGYVAVTVRESGALWGTPARYTSDSSTGAVAYLLLGEAGGCSVADSQAARGATAYVRTAELGYLPSFESATACRSASSTWTSGWDGLRITHLRVFDESSPTNVTEYVYDDETGLYVGTTPTPAARRTAASPASGTPQECSSQWARQPELPFAEAIRMCGGDVEALRAAHVEACATSDPAEGGLGWRTYADFARDSEIEARARAGEARDAGNEDEAIYYEEQADRYADEVEHTANLAYEAWAAESDRRARIITERGVTSWPEACRQMTDELWQLDRRGLATAGDDLASHFGELADVVCGGYTHDLDDLCGGIDLLDLGFDAIGLGLDAVGGGLDALGGGLDAAGGGLGALFDGIGSMFDAFGAFGAFGF